MSETVTGHGARRLSVLSKAHQMRDVANPTRDPTVQALVRRIRLAFAACGARTDRKTALITRDPLEAMLATCTDGLVSIRDRALLLFGFASGGRRRSEIASAVLENLTTPLHLVARAFVAASAPT